MRKRIWETYNSFYFIGAGGVSMSALAKFLLLKGAKVAGSDKSHSVYVDDLTALGAEIFVGDCKKSIEEFDVIVYTDAINESNLQLAQARGLNKPIISRGQLLTEISRSFERVIAISGCHGKTTAASMLAHIFMTAEKGFCAHIGGRDAGLSNFYYCGNEYFITEACEYKQNFLLLKPDIAVVLNTDPDHLECYGNAENLRLAYKRFAGSAEIAVTPFNDLQIGGLTFGYNKNADYSAENIIENSGKFSFDICEKGVNCGKVSLCVYGKHNVLNALAAAAAARAAGISFEAVKKGLLSFTGVERRFEHIGNANGAEIIADYAHHPDEIAAAINTANSIVKGRLLVIFQPHTYSRTKNLFKDFIKALSPLKNLLVYRTFAAREYFDDAGSALTLSQGLCNSRYGDEIRDISEFMSGAQSGDIILVLGAGDIYELAKSAAANFLA